MVAAEKKRAALEKVRKMSRKRSVQRVEAERLIERKETHLSPYSSRL